MVNWNKAASLRHCRMGAQTEFHSPSEKQANSDRNKAPQSADAPPYRAFSAEIRARTKRTSRPLSAPCPSVPTFGQNGRTGPLSHWTILAIDEGERDRESTSRS